MTAADVVGTPFSYVLMFLVVGGAVYAIYQKKKTGKWPWKK